METNTQTGADQGAKAFGYGCAALLVMVGVSALAVAAALLAAVIR